MNREIRFRAWDGIDYMSAPFDLYDIQDRSIQFTTGAVIMQFTGLKDKNGKEIFEGDIIKTETDKPMVISWNEKFASFCIDREGWAFSHWFGESCNPEKVEIIGNIHEHKHLLS